MAPEGKSIVHVVEIRLGADEPWEMCDVFVHPVERSVAMTVCDIANKVKAHVSSQGDTSKTQTTRTLEGNLVGALIHVDHDAGSSFFRHWIGASKQPGAWLNRRSFPRTNLKGQTS